MTQSPPTDPARRQVMAGLGLTPVAAAALSGQSLAADAATQISGDEARRQRSSPATPDLFPENRCASIIRASRREAIAPAQMPFAIVLGCSDSRVPPEILFDQGLGDLFTVRVAGNIADDLALGSMEYAVEHFACNAAHRRSGARAMRRGQRRGGIGGVGPDAAAPYREPGRRHPARRRGEPWDAGRPRRERAITTHVRLTVATLKASAPVLADAVQKNHLAILGAEYHLASFGRVYLFCGLTSGDPSI